MGTWRAESGKWALGVQKAVNCPGCLKPVILKRTLDESEFARGFEEHASCWPFRATGGMITWIVGSEKTQNESEGERENGVRREERRVCVKKNLSFFGNGGSYVM